MVVIDPLEISKNPLEPFENVLKRQKPEVLGEPFDMQVFSNDYPKNVGNPWKGAYSQHGFWYKFHWGTKEDFEKLVAFSQSQNEYFLKYELFDVWEKVGGENFRMICVKNLNGEFMGGVTIFPNECKMVIGSYFMVEEYRHSGIGEKMFMEISKCTDGRPIVFNAMHHVHPTLQNFGLSLQKNTRVDQIVTKNPSGFPSLIENLKDIKVLPTSEFSTENWNQLSQYDEGISKENRHDFLKEFLTMESANSVGLFKKNGTMVGFGGCREVAGGSVRRIFVGPIYANKGEQAELILREILKKYYNPDEDFDFDPDPHALYRREVHFFVPSQNTQMPGIINKLTGIEGAQRRERLWYQTASSSHLASLDYSDIFAISDLHSTFV